MQRRTLRLLWKLDRDPEFVSRFGRRPDWWIPGRERVERIQRWDSVISSVASRISPLALAETLAGALKGQGCEPAVWEILEFLEFLLESLPAKAGEFMQKRRPSNGQETPARPDSSKSF